MASKLHRTTVARVSSITVAFNPNPERLAEQIAALLDQVEQIIVVDNGSQPSVEHILSTGGAQSQGPRVKVMTLQDNEGVARGFNIGVGEARTHGAQYVLLLDHDSVPAANMVDLLVAGFQDCAAASGGNRVAAVGPRVNDLREPREYPFIRLGWLRNRHVRCIDAEQGVVACDFLISSGSLIPIESFAAIGEFDEALFIDSVDLEWCCRARSRGFALYGVCAAWLDHRLGDRRELLKGVDLVVHSPKRIYYMTRNRILLYGRPYMPLKWKLKDLLRALAKFLAMVLLVRPRLEYAKMTLRGIRDAVARRGGKFTEDRA
jgi:rhamnosyltransferase